MTSHAPVQMTFPPHSEPSPRYATDGPTAAPFIHHRVAPGAQDASQAPPRILMAPLQPIPPFRHDQFSGDVVPVESEPAGPHADDEQDGPDTVIIEALKNVKERIFVLKLGESMEALIRERM